MATIQNQLQQRHYTPPQLIVRGNIAELTQANKTFGNGDGLFLVIPNSGISPIPITDYS
jgi:hypothetical protein